MLTILGKTYRLCDGIPRRSFLRVGAALTAGLGLAPLTAVRAAAPGRSPAHKALIVVYLPGGPSHLDLFDLKPDAPREIRGDFRPIRTRVPGVTVSELFPRLARSMDRLAIIRTVVGGADEHASNVCLTGHSQRGPQAAGGWPTVGAVLSRVRGPADPAVPPSVSLLPRMAHAPYNDPGPGFLGVGHAAFTPGGAGQDDLVLRGVTPERLEDRRQLLRGFDTLRRDLDSGTFQGMDAVREQALGVLTSARLRDALDLSREDPRVRDRYGRGDPGVDFDAAPRLTEHFLLARRLVEAGARCVALAFGSWDWHERGFEGLRRQAPALDRGLAALVEDLRDRGLDRDVSVVTWGEFGRSPRVNRTAGREHWPAVSCALLAGGGMRLGQVIGETTRLGEAVKTRPVHFREVLATLYHNLGVDARGLTLPDLSGRPQHIVGDYRPIPELL